MSKRLTKDEFIQRSIAVHGNKYGYDLVEYKSNKEKVAILCHKHGIFYQAPDKHLLGRGCPKCKIENSAILRALPFEEFVNKARQKHGNKYQYDESSYSKASEHLRIICPIHGEFTQCGSMHLSGNGCPKCRIKERGIKRRYSTEEYKKKAIAVHGDKYDYTKVHYKTSHDRIIIGCLLHGDFSQMAYMHLLGEGCPCCSGTKKSTTGEFITKAKKVHGERFDYSLVKYKGNKSKVAIICKEHGVFYQTPNDHLCGKACPQCNESIGERKISKFLKSVGIEFKREKRFDNCKNLRCLPFDFYLPQNNICIEFQGEQHYRPVEAFGGEDAFEDTQLRDQIKRDYCASHGIKLIEIRYDQDIEQELKKHLSL